MAEPRIDEAGLPVYAPGDYDYVRVVDRSTGASRNALAPEVTAAARAISEAIDGLVADARDEIDEIISELGYLAPVPYDTGLDVEDIKFTVSYNGDVYAPKPDLVPFTTGAWDPDQWNVIQGDINLRSDLADPTGGAGLVAFPGGRVVSDLATSFGAGMVGFQAPWTGGQLRSIASKLGESVSVLDFIPSEHHAAIRARTSTYDCIPAFAAAFAAARRVYAPQGRYYCNTTLTVPANSLLFGDGNATTIYANGVTGPAVQVGPDGVGTINSHIENINIAGVADMGLSLNNCQVCSLRNITLGGGTFTNGVFFQNIWPGAFSNISTNGATISNHCFVFGAEVNAAHFEGLYTSNFCEANFYYDGSGHGTVFTTPTAQGGRVGFYIKHMGGVGGLTVSGLYIENVARPIVLGGRGGNDGGAANVTFIAPLIGGPFDTHPHRLDTWAAVELNSASNVTFLSPLFIGTYLSAGGFPTVTISGDGTGARAIARITPTGEVHSVEVVHPGTGYTSATAVITGGGGSGATLTATVADGKVTGIAVTAAGSGYKRTQTPMALVYDRATNIKVSGAMVQSNMPGSQRPFYPFMGRVSGSAITGQTIHVDDVSARVTTTGAAASVMKTSGTPQTFAVVEYTGAGTQSVYVYTAPNYP